MKFKASFNGGQYLTISIYLNQLSPSSGIYLVKLFCPGVHRNKGTHYIQFSVSRLSFVVVRS